MSNRLNFLERDRLSADTLYLMRWKSDPVEVKVDGCLHIQVCFKDTRALKLDGEDKEHWCRFARVSKVLAGDKLFETFPDTDIPVNDIYEIKNLRTNETIKKRVDYVSH